MAFRQLDIPAYQKFSTAPVACAQMQFETSRVGIPAYAFRRFSLVANTGCNCNGPLGHSHYRMTASTTNVYVARSVEDGSTIYLGTWSYNLASQKWNKLTNDKYPLEMATIRESVSLLDEGGYTAPKTLFGHRVWHEGNLYDIGGLCHLRPFNPSTMRVHRYDSSTLLWEDLSAENNLVQGMPLQNRIQHQCVSDGKCIFVVGGNDIDGQCSLEKIPVLEVATNTWRFVTTQPDRTDQILYYFGGEEGGYPLPRKDFSCVLHTLANGDLCAVMVGGWHMALGTYIPTQCCDVWTLNLRTMEWQDRRTARLPRFVYHVAATTDGHGSMYVYATVAKYGRYDVKRKIVLKMWLTVPKLSEMCWEAMTHYIGPKIGEADPKDLYKIGIPKRFIERLNEDATE